MAGIVSIWALFLVTKIIEPGECLSGVRQAFLQVNDETYLPNHVIETKHAETELECSMHCFQHGTCMSVNYKISGAGKGRCELNRKTPRNTFDDGGRTRNPEFKHIHIMEELPKIFPTCSILRRAVPTAGSGEYWVNPQGFLVPVFCNMTSKNGVGVTEIGHDSESRTLVNGREPPGSYKKTIKYNIPMEQLFAIMKKSKNCEQFIKYECYDSRLFRGGFGWWVSRSGSRMNYWGGAAVESGKCACGMTNTCAGGGKCNCDNNDKRWREDSGYLTDKTTLPVTELRFGDTGLHYEKGYHTLEELRCWD